MIIGYVLLALGLAVFVVSFLIPVKTEDEKATEFSEEVIKDLVEKEVESAKGQLNDIVDETITYAMEKTERSIDRITNEKMMAVNEYSDTVLTEINKNHQEVVFLYDMLNDKHENIKDTVSEVDKKTSMVKQAVLDAQLTAKETEERVLEAKDAAQMAAQTALEAQQATKTSALERLQQMQLKNKTKDEEERETDRPVIYDDNFSPISARRIIPASAGAESAEAESAEEEKPAKKKRVSKPKVKEEQSFDISQEPSAIKPGEGATALKKSPDLTFGAEKTLNNGGRNSNERILELHNLGKSNVAIAKELGLGVGEVNFVIDLFEGKK